MKGFSCCYSSSTSTSISSCCCCSSFEFQVTREKSLIIIIIKVFNFLIRNQPFDCKPIKNEWKMMIFFFHFHFYFLHQISLSLSSPLSLSPSLPLSSFGWKSSYDFQYLPTTRSSFFFLSDSSQPSLLVKIIKLWRKIFPVFHKKRDR